MRPARLTTAVAVCLFALLSGCVFSDPNLWGQARFQMAHRHAQRVVSPYGITPYAPNYDLEIFWRKHYDAATGKHHSYELYDFLKVSPQPGPDRFVIAYDRATRKTYLRADLRSNDNLETLRSVGSPARVD